MVCVNFVSVEHATKWKETRNRAGTRVHSMPAKWMLNGRIGTVNWVQQREEGGGVRHRRQEEAGLCTLLHSSRVIYLIVFVHTACSPAGAGAAQKGWRSVKPPKAWPLVRGLLPFANSYATH